MTDWDSILRDHGPTVWRTAYRLLGNRADADDCFQETFVAAVRSERRQTVRNWSALLQTLATSRAVDRLRQRYRTRAADDSAIDFVAGNALDPLLVAENAELSEQLRRALSRLKEEQARVFCLHALSGWSYQEIGQELSMSSSAVGVTIHRAKLRLREILAGAGVGDVS